MRRKIYICLMFVFVFCLGIPQIVNAENTIGLINDRVGQVRNGPTTSGTTVLRTLDPGQEVIIDETVTNSYGNKWYKVSFYVNGTKMTGYTYSSHITIYKHDASFDAIANTFPESYRQQLRYLHCLYPNWKFKKLDAKYEFDKDAFEFQKKALVDGNDELLRVDNTLIEGKNWYRANLKTTSYFLDVRNMLMLNNALMFEDLADGSSTLQSVETILRGTYMDSIEEISEKRWAQLFIEAGKIAKCSANFLAIRALQEQGTTGQGGLGSIGGIATQPPLPEPVPPVEPLPPVEGETPSDPLPETPVIDDTIYYNIFNIGARGGAQDGIDYAKEKQWTTREISIVEGAKFIAQNYISQRQNSLYLQRFNVDPASPNGRYSHSYMTNIRAPYSEGVKTLKSYDDMGILNMQRTLIVPVFSNLPKQVEYPGKMDVITLTPPPLPDPEPPVQPDSPKPPKPVEPTYLKGDVDGNGSVTAVDYMLIKNHIMGVAALTDGKLSRADVNKDGKVTAVDYMLIKNHIMGVSLLF